MRILLITIITILAGISAYLIREVSQLRDSRRIAFVRSQDLLDKYKGMEEAKNAYSVKFDKWQAEVDTAQVKYERAVNEYQSTNDGNKKGILKDIIENLGKAFQEKQKDFEAISKSEDERLVKSVLDKVNIFIHDYGKENNYQVIFGITTSGNILYGSDAIDITQPVLDGLNKQYLK